MRSIGNACDPLLRLARIVRAAGTRVLIPGEAVNPAAQSRV